MASGNNAEEVASGINAEGAHSLWPWVGGRGGFEQEIFFSIIIISLVLIHFGLLLVRPP